MKRSIFLFTFSLLMIVCLFGCDAKDKSIGIIGGADGPTSIIVSDMK